MENIKKPDYCESDVSYLHHIVLCHPYSHSKFTLHHRWSLSTQSIFELHSHFQQRNKASVLASLTGISSPHHHSCRASNDEAEPWEEGLNVIQLTFKNFTAWICSTDPSHCHVIAGKSFSAPSSGKDEGKQGHRVWWSLEESAASWASGNWKCTADALYMHPLPAPPAALTFVLKHAHTHSHVQAHTQRDEGKGSYELWIGAMSCGRGMA